MLAQSGLALAAAMLAWLTMLIIAFFSYRVEVLSNRRTGWEFSFLATALALLPPLVAVAYLQKGADIPLGWRLLYSASSLLASLALAGALKRLRNSMVVESWA
ncbi:MAG: hypothetical protein QXH27_04635 [Candidatus Micrarchaeia archaeon]